jgi:hypothetical protein
MISAFRDAAASAEPVDAKHVEDAVDRLLNNRWSGQSLLALRSEASRTSAFFARYVGKILHCSHQELWRFVEEGFQGTILLPGFSAWDIDLERLLSLPGVQIVIPPEDAGDGG